MDVSINIYNKHVFWRRWKVLLLWYSIILFFLFFYATHPPPHLYIKYCTWPGPLPPLKNRARPKGSWDTVISLPSSVPSQPRLFCSFWNVRFFVRRWRALVLKPIKQSTSKLLEFSLTVYTQYTRLETTYHDSGKITKWKPYMRNPIGVITDETDYLYKYKCRITLQPTCNSSVHKLVV